MLWKRIVEFGFYLLYNQFAWLYDIVSWIVSLGEWRKWQVASLNFLKGPNVLEIAHGPGHMLIEMHQRGWSVTGLDLSTAMGRVARARLERHGLNHEIPLIRCHVPDIAFQSAIFDGILSQFPTRFIFETETLKTFHRLLKPAGVLVILPEGHLTSEGLIARLIHWLFVITGQTAGNRDTGQDENPADDRLNIFWETYKLQLAAAGFTADIHSVHLEKSVATVIVAQKE
ncbi:MAG: ubiquinone/menaquinone biosynthesis C-methylase UbiE [Candidatus Promineifilaceae bacterium]|jgi:ubiquinone/menaquinone biosynthesis C-methylase UbiE